MSVVCQFIGLAAIVLVVVGVGVAIIAIKLQQLLAELDDVLGQ
jgi:hypothetical protein